MIYRPLVAALALCLPLSLAATAGTAPPWSMPDLTFAAATGDTTSTPPPLAREDSYLTNVKTVTFPGTIASFRRFFDANPVTDFVVATDAIPEITGITYLTGTWPEPGATREVQLAGGNTVQERVLTNTPTLFEYQIWDITAPAGRVVDHIKGAFVFRQDAGVVTVEWTYNIKPRVFLARKAIKNYLTNDFAPFMDAGLTGVVDAYLD